MKKFYTLFLLLSLSLSASATIHTVSNIDSSAQFSTIQTACDASNSGDSIYVSASPYNYDAFTVDSKKLAVFGPGWWPFVGVTANVPSCILTGTGASGSELHGLYILGAIAIRSSDVNNIIISRNKLTGIDFSNYLATNYIIEGNWFIGVSIRQYYQGNQVSHLLVKNNIFFECSFSFGPVGDSVIIDHNLFYGRGWVAGPSQGSNLIVSNNDIQLDFSACSYSTFNNNITYNSGYDTPWSTNNNIDAGGNIAGENPQMVDEASVDADVNNPLLNFTITSGPANNTGSDGKDMGLLFDKGKVTNWNYCRAAHLPYITDFNITDQNISANSYIHFNAKAKSN